MTHTIALPNPTTCHCRPPAGYRKRDVYDWTVMVVGVLLLRARRTGWNSLPDSLRESAPSLNIFKRQLKTHFFA